MYAYNLQLYRSLLVQLYTDCELDFADEFTNVDVFSFIALAYALHQTTVELTMRQDNTPTLIITPRKVSVILADKVATYSLLDDYSDNFEHVEDDLTNLLTNIQLSFLKLQLRLDDAAVSSP